MLEPLRGARHEQHLLQLLVVEKVVERPATRYDLFLPAHLALAQGIVAHVADIGIDQAVSQPDGVVHLVPQLVCVIWTSRTSKAQTPHVHFGHFTQMPVDVAHRDGGTVNTPELPGLYGAEIIVGK